MSVRVSLRQVAEAAGVSISTVSQALRRDGRISAKTRESIEEIARRLGYRRDPLISQFASRKFHHDSHLLGSTLLFVTARPSDFRSNAPMYHAAFKARAEELGYNFEHIEFPRECDYQKLQRQWFYRGVRGIAFGNVLCCPWLLEEPAPNFAVVCLGGSIRKFTYHVVKSEVSTAVIGVWERVRTLGYKKIGFALCRHANEVLDDQLRHGIACMIAARDRLSIPVYDGSMEEPQPLRAWMKKYAPDAVIGFPGIVAFWMCEAGFRVPEDCAFFQTTASALDSCAGWIENDDAIASRGADLLDTMIRHGDVGMPSPPTITLVAGSWHDGVPLPAGHAGLRDAAIT